jgi:folate-binding protein YgfZ
MSESFPNPLLDLHRQPETEFQPYADLEIVSTFGQPEAEYAAIHKSAGLMDLPQRGILELSGKDRLPFLNNLISNQVWDKQTKQGIAAGQGVYAFLLNAKSGRIIADLNVLELGDRTLLDLDVRLIQSVQQALERYLFAEQVKIASRVGELHQIALHGPGASELLRSMGVSPMPTDPLQSSQVSFLDTSAVLYRDDFTGASGYFLILPTADAPRIWTALIDRSQSDTLGKRPLRPIGWAAFNATRIEAGRPLFGIDFDDSILPAETGEVFSRAVSLTKGCYPGQEIVARMHARQQVAKKLVGIRMESDALPIAGTKIQDADGNEIGGVTSSTVSPILSNLALCLGYLKRPHFNVGTVVQIPAEGAMRKGVVVETPFMKKRQGEAPAEPVL